MNEVELANQRKYEDSVRELLKAAGAHRPIAIHDSEDPNSGLQPAVGSHDAWPYRHASPVKPLGFVTGYEGGVERDLAAERRAAEGERFVPRCTGCLARLDPKWCGHIADDDRDAR